MIAMIHGTKRPVPAAPSGRSRRWRSMFVWRFRVRRDPAAAVRGELAMVEHNDVMAEALDQAVVVSRDDNRRTDAIELLEQAQDAQALRLIDAARGLVGNQ